MSIKVEVRDDVSGGTSVFVNGWHWTVAESREHAMSIKAVLEADGVEAYGQDPEDWEPAE